MNEIYARQRSLTLVLVLLLSKCFVKFHVAGPEILQWIFNIYSKCFMHLAVYTTFFWTFNFKNLLNSLLLSKLRIAAIFGFFDKCIQVPTYAKHISLDSKCKIYKTSVFFLWKHIRVMCSLSENRQCMHYMFNSAFWN